MTFSRNTAEMPFTAKSVTLRKMLLSVQRRSHLADDFLGFVKAIWLFTRSDLNTIVVPSTAFAILTVLSGPVLTTNSNPQLYSTLARVPQIVFWTWINLLPFNIDNQRRPNSIQEDAANKPWRPMPSKLISQPTAFKLIFIAYASAIASSIYLGGLTECFIIAALTFCYNTLRGADIHWSMKNLLNACGNVYYALGATEVAVNIQEMSDPFNPIAKYWFLVLGAVFATSGQVQDMRDQAGDRIRGRKTLPLVIGDRAARITIALTVGFWSIFCPSFWGFGIAPHAVSMMFGFHIALRSLKKTSVSDDQQTFHLWNIWMVMLYLMPVFKRFEDEIGL